MFKSGNLLALAVILLVGAWQLATLRGGHEWGDDFSLYVGHARNLAEGVDYADTGYVYNPSFPSLSPRTYPPVLPLLLAPVYRCCGLNLAAMKVELVVLFLLFLGTLYLAFRRELPTSCLLATLLLLGLNPYLWDYKDRILSEVPFLLFSYAALLFLGRANEAATTQWRVAFALLTGAAVYLACGTRSVGIVLVPCVLLEEIIRRRRPGLVSLGVLGVFALGVLAQRLLLPFDGSYLDQLVFAPALFARNFLSLLKALGLYLDNGYSNPLRLTLFGALTALALAGYVLRLRRRVTANELFVVFYLGAVTVWPSAEWGQRFLLPVLPLYFVYAWHGLLGLCEAARTRRARPLGIGLTAAVLASYLGCYSRLDFGPLRDGVGKAESRALFDYVRRETGPDSVFLFQKPRALALFTGRHASAHHTPRSDQELWQYLRRIRATHVIVGRVFAHSHAVLQPFVRRQAGYLQAVYDNPDFTVYRIRELPPDAAPALASGGERRERGQGAQ